MRQIISRMRRQAKEIAQNKYYTAVILAAAVLSYGFLITHSAVGIDDTPYRYYFEEGLNVIVGRWTLFLLNKVFPVAEYAPFITDLAGVVLFMAAVTCWTAFFKEILERRIPFCGYVMFAAVFLTCPLISEVYTYHLHNGISLGYLFAAVSLWFFRGALDQFPQKRKRGGIASFCCAILALWIAIGCYESLMVVWILGVCLMLLSERLGERKRNIFSVFLVAILVVGCAIALRSGMRIVLTGVFRLGYMNGDAKKRAVGEMFSWITDAEGISEFSMILKRCLVMYGAFAYAYLPIKVFVLAVSAMILAGIAYCVRRRDFWILFLVAAAFVSCFLLVPIEGKVTLYRAAQFLPVICGYGVMILAKGIYGVSEGLKRRKKKSAVYAGRLIKVAGIFAFGALLWRQCFDMNHWFYVDYLKYEDAKGVAEKIYRDLQYEYDLNKPVVFTGNYYISEKIIGDAYVPYGSPDFYKINRIASWIDGHLLEKYYRPYGVWVAQTPALSVIDWGREAFDDDGEMVNFFALLGYEIVPLTGVDYTPIENAAVGMPGFPAKGYIEDKGDYIVVNF